MRRQRLGKRRIERNAPLNREPRKNCADAYQEERSCGRGVACVLFRSTLRLVSKAHAREIDFREETAEIQHVLPQIRRYLCTTSCYTHIETIGVLDARTKTDVTPQDRLGQPFFDGNPVEGENLREEGLLVGQHLLVGYPAHLKTRCACSPPGYVELYIERRTEQDGSSESGLRIAVGNIGHQEVVSIPRRKVVTQRYQTVEDVSHEDYGPERKFLQEGDILRKRYHVLLDDMSLVSSIPQPLVNQVFMQTGFGILVFLVSRVVAQDVGDEAGSRLGEGSDEDAIRFHAVCYVLFLVLSAFYFQLYLPKLDLSVNVRTDSNLRWLYGVKRRGLLLHH